MPQLLFVRQYKLSDATSTVDNDVVQEKKFSTCDGISVLARRIRVRMTKVEVW
jgi:hypothetical protein